MLQPVVVCLAVRKNNSKGYERILMNLSGNVDTGPMKIPLSFGDVPDPGGNFDL